MPSIRKRSTLDTPLLDYEYKCFECHLPRCVEEMTTKEQHRLTEKCPLRQFIEEKTGQKAPHSIMSTNVYGRANAFVSDDTNHIPVRSISIQIKTGDEII